MKKVLALAMAAALALSATTLPALAEGSTTEPVHIVYYNNSGKLGSTGLAGSQEAAYNAVHDVILNATGVDVEVIVPPVGSETEKLNTLLASQSPLDLFWGSWGQYNDAIQPITDSMNNYGKNILAAWPQEAIAGMMNGEDYMGIMRGTPGTCYPVFLRTDWLEKCGLKMPTTIDELENVLKTFKETDPAGNGQTIPLGCDLTGLNMGLSAAFTGVGYGNYLDAEDKCIKPVTVHPLYKAFIEKMADWYSKGYIYAEAFSSTRAIYNELITQGNVGGWAYWYSLTTLRSPYLTANMPEAQYDFKALTGEKGLAETHTNATNSGGLIPAYSKNADAVVKFVDWQYSDVTNHLICDAGIEDVQWKYIDKENHVIEAITTEEYIGEFVASQGLPMETSYSFNDPLMKKHNSYLRDQFYRFDESVGADDWRTIYDATRLSDECMTKGDIDRMIAEEPVKFITGVRPMSDWDAFMQELQNAGLQELIDARTAQYNEQSAK